MKKIESFTSQKPSSSGGGGGNASKASFDVDLAIKVCRQAGYNACAVRLAKDHRRHEWYLRMQIEDEKK